MALKFAFKAALAVSATAAAGYGGYHGATYAHNYLAETPAADIFTDVAPAKARAYNERFTELQNRQRELENTTDDERNSARLSRDKRAFATDALLDRLLSERDLLPLAARFNAIGQEDGITFTSYAASPRAIAKRNECLGITAPATSSNRDATAAQVETCMTDMMQRTPEGDALAGQMGGMAGTGMALAFLLGRASRRRPGKAAAPEQTTPAAGPK